jgi:glycosyltransferase involved in cell wall biosynthesis
MKINLYISTLNREEKLKRCINSILANDYKDWRLVIRSNVRRENLLINANKELAGMDGEWFLGLSDDMELHPDCLSKLIEVAQKIFPDTDGAIGICQVNIPDAPESALIAVGRKFLERFPNKKLVCEDYHYFADREQFLYMQEVGKFFYTKEVKVNHYHPSFYPGEMDATHRELREGDPDKKDAEIYDARRAKGWLWGRDFNRLCL